MSNTSKPIHTLRYGSIQATVWARNTLHGVFFDVTVARRYKDDSGQWHEAHHFADTGLPTLAKAVLDAHTWIYERKAEAARPKAD